MVGNKSPSKFSKISKLPSFYSCNFKIIKNAPEQFILNRTPKYVITSTNCSRFFYLSTKLLFLCPLKFVRSVENIKYCIKCHTMPWWNCFRRRLYLPVYCVFFCNDRFIVTGKHIIYEKDRKRLWLTKQKYCKVIID